MRDASPRHDVAGTVFSTWVVLGLFLDGWAHNAGKPEDFWTPWHGVLYSGFAAAVLWYAVDRNRARRRGERTEVDPLIVLGFVAFGIAGVGDAVWHTVFGIEEDVAALLSPTHLALMIGGLLLITGPLRREEPTTVREGWRRTYPTVAAITLAAATVAFFLQFATPFHVVSSARYAATGTETDHVLGVVGLLLTNALLVAAIGWALTRRDLPTGACSAVLGTMAVLLSGLGGFDRVELAVAAVAAGLVLDVALRRGVRRRTALLLLPAVLWPTWFVVYDLGWGLGWPAEYWTGAVVLAALTAFGVDALLGEAPQQATGTTRPPADVRPAGVGYSVP